MEFERKNTRERRYVPQKIQDVTRIKTDPTIRHIGEELFQEKYIITHKLNYEFWSNDAQLEMKTRYALEATYAHLFKDMLPIVHDILASTHDPEIQEMCHDLLDLMKHQRRYER